MNVKMTLNNVIMHICVPIKHVFTIMPEILIWSIVSRISISKAEGSSSLSVSCVEKIR